MPFKKNLSGRMIGRPRHLKYGNKKCKLDGITFDSIKEMNRYVYLKNLEKKGEIKDLECHPIYKLTLPDGTPVLIEGDKRNTHAYFKPDFQYRTLDNRLIIEDVKSKVTASEKYFKLKKAVFKAIEQAKGSDIVLNIII